MIIKSIKTPGFQCGKIGISWFARIDKTLFCESAHPPTISSMLRDEDQPAFTGLLSIYIEFARLHLAQAFEQRMRDGRLK